jgi:hypothetical protein
MKSADAAAVTSIAKAALLAVTSADTGDITPAERALGRAKSQLSAVSKRWPAHARVRRLARKPIECAEAFLAATKTEKPDPDDLGRLYRATERAVQAVLAEAGKLTAPVSPA